MYRLLRLFYKSQSALTPLLLLFRKKSRSAHLFGCKRPHNGLLSLPTFCDLRGFRSIRQIAKISFLCASHNCIAGRTPEQFDERITCSTNQKTIVNTGIPKYLLWFLFISSMLYHDVYWREMSLISCKIRVLKPTFR